MNQEKEILDKIHKVSLRILLVFDKVCRENNLTYFLDSGTALGAVRHGGFIPWDDDVDVGMPRKDYERFLQIAQEQLPEEYFLQTHDTDPAYKRNAAKLRLKGTIMQEFENLPFEENGLFIDIFPFDNVPSNKYCAKIYVGISRVFARFARFINSSRRHIQNSSRVLRVMQIFIRRIPESQIDRMNRVYASYCRLFEYYETGYLTSHFYYMLINNTYIFDNAKMLPVREITFEGHSLKIMKDSNYYLRLMYGDYMQLPPENKRHFHLKGMVDFGTYA